MDWKDHLKPYATALANMEDEIRKLSDAQFSQIEWAVTQPTETNCWAFTYHAAQVLKPMVARRKMWRAINNGGE